MTASAADIINALSSNKSSSGTGTAKNSASSLNINDFITLMAAQLQNQDPNNPQDPTQYVSQLAQFATVSGVQSMQSSIGDLSTALRTSQALSGTSMVGHEVLAAASSSSFTSGSTLVGGATVPADASNMVVTVSDSNGQPIRHISVTPQTGLTGFTWDGKTDAGTQAPTGTYGFAATANVAGATRTLPTLLTGTVQSVSIDPSTSSLTLNTGSIGAVPVASVQQVM